MATVTAPARRVPRVIDVRQPQWLDRLPNWALVGGILVVLMGLSAFIRTRYIGAEFWMDEAITTGIASESDCLMIDCATRSLLRAAEAAVPRKHGR